MRIEGDDVVEVEETVELSRRAPSRSQEEHSEGGSDCKGTHHHVVVGRGRL